MNNNNYEYSYEENDDIYCYPNSVVLINKFGIKDYKKLSEVERDITFTKIVELENNPVKGKYDLKHLQSIHKRLFDDIYPWAGKTRQGEFLRKGTSIFCRGQFIDGYAEKIFSELKSDNFLKGLDKTKFIEKLAYYMSEANALHPFREGNGRTLRAFFSQLTKAANYEIDFTKAEKEELLFADIEAYNKNYKPLINVLDQIIQKSISRSKGSDQVVKSPIVDRKIKKTSLQKKLEKFQEQISENQIKERDEDLSKKNRDTKTDR